VTFRDWWNAREPREQRVLGVGAVIAVLVLAWSVIWHPLSASLDALQARVSAQRADLAGMQQAAARVATLRGQGARAKGERQGKSLLALADASARGNQLGNALKRVEPLGPKSVRVSLEGAAFDSLIDWLDGLSRDFGVVATDFSADRVEGVGLVNARVTLEEP
jgi:general secretion pathway protein M